MIHPDELVKLLKRVAPRKLRITLPDGETKTLVVPPYRNKWAAVMRMLEGEPWVRLELLDKAGDVMGPPIERDLGGGAGVDVDVSPNASAGAAGAGFQLASLAGIVQLVVKAQQVVLDEHRRSFETIMQASLHTLQVVTARLEGMEKSADKLLRLAFDTTRAQAALASIGDGDDKGGSGEAIVGFLQAYLAGIEEKKAAREAQQRPGGGAAPGANGHRPSG